MLEKIRCVVAETFSATDIGPWCDGVNVTPVHVGLLEAWRCAAKDPDEEVTSWLKHGCPAGIRNSVAGCGIFPDVSDEGQPDLEDGELLDTDFGTFLNYSSVDGDSDAEAEVLRLVQEGHLKACASPAEVEQYLGVEPVLSKLGLIVKVKGDTVKSA